MCKVHKRKGLFTRKVIVTVFVKVTVKLNTLCEGDGHLGYNYTKAKATSLPICCIVFNLCVYTTATAAATNAFALV